VKDSPIHELLNGHMKFIKSFTLLAMNPFDKEALIPGKEEESKGGKKKRKAANPLTDVPALIKIMDQALQTLSKVGEVELTESKWAE
jgi:hypothetical protein